MLINYDAIPRNVIHRRISPAQNNFRGFRLHGHMEAQGLLVVVAPNALATARGIEWVICAPKEIDGYSSN
jgi:hypothetical protein